MSDPFLDGGSGLPVLKFADVGDGHKFQVVDAKQQRDTDLEGNVRTWPNGDERMVWVFEVDTTCTGSPADARVFMRGNLFTVVREALKAANVGTIGAVIEAKHHALGEPTKKGYSPPKLFKARASAGPAIKPPTDDFVGADEDPF
jgi:hypothetical protein